MCQEPKKTIEDKQSINDTRSTIIFISFLALITAIPNQTLETVLNIMVDNKVGRLPVVDIKDKKRIIGIISKEDILKTYREM